MNWGVATLAACPFVDVARLSDGTVVSGCVDWNTRQMAALLEDRPDVVFIAGSWDGYVLDDQHHFLDRERDVRAKQPSEKRDMLLHSLARVARRLAENGSVVVLVEVVPKAANDGPMLNAVERLAVGGVFRCSLASLASVPSQCEVPLVKLWDEEWTSNLVDRADHPLVVGLNVGGELCADDGCPLVDLTNQRITYFDVGHLSPSASRRINVRWGGAVREGLDLAESLDDRD